MAWTVDGTVVSDEKGWTFEANRLVHRVSQWRPSGKGGNQGPTGYKAKGGPRFHRAMAEMARNHRLKKHV